MGLHDKVCDKLKEPLEAYTRKGPGGTYSYYKGSDVIRRLNEAFGHSWSSEKIETVVIEDQVLLLLSLTVFVEGDTIIHQGYGSALIVRRGDTNKIIDIGNTYKSAFTNALKKAAEQFGIGLGGEEDIIRPNQGVSMGNPQVATGGSRLPMQAPAPAPAVPSGTSMSRPEPLPVRPRGNGSTMSVRDAAVAAIKGAQAPESTPDPTPTPDLSGEVVTPTQVTALTNLSKLRNKGEIELLVGALPGTDKTEFKQLLRSEAIQVIRHANNLPLRG